MASIIHFNAIFVIVVFGYKKTQSRLQFATDVQLTSEPLVHSLFVVTTFCHYVARVIHFNAIILVYG